MTASLESEGTIGMWIYHEHVDWNKNNSMYRFSPIRSGAVELSITKRADRKLRILLSGPFGNEFPFVEKMPNSTRPVPDIEQRRGVYVAVTWKYPTVTLYLNGQVTATRAVRAH